MQVPGRPRAGVALNAVRTESSEPPERRDVCTSVIERIGGGHRGYSS